MITWAEKIAFVGLTAKRVPRSKGEIYAPFHVKVSYNPGLCSFGWGNTFDEAIGSAAQSLPIDWYSVERKITEKAWQAIAHT